jgi:hypothetical protein
MTVPMRRCTLSLQFVYREVAEQRGEINPP